MLDHKDKKKQDDNFFAKLKGNSCLITFTVLLLVLIIIYR